MTVDGPNHDRCDIIDCSGLCHVGLECDFESELKPGPPPATEWLVCYDEPVCRFCPAGVGAERAGRNVAEARHKLAGRPLKGQRRLF